MRTLCCDSDRYITCGVCPNHDFLPVVRKHALPGELIAPQMDKININSIRRAIPK